MGDTISYLSRDNNENRCDCDRCEDAHGCETAHDTLLAARARADELAGYNEALATDCGAAHRRIVALEAALESARRRNVDDARVQSGEITTLRLQLRESENARLAAVRRVEELQRCHDEARYDADGLKENKAVARGCGPARRRLKDPRQTPLCTQRSQDAEVAQLRKRWVGSENARRLQVAENAQLERQLRECNAARAAAVRRAEELQHSHDVALRQIADIRVATETAVAAARTKVQTLQQANAVLNMRCGAFMQQQAQLLASMASLGHELDVARGHARAMKRMAMTLSSMPPKQAVAAVCAVRAEAREARMRERSLAFAKSALELANRAERHRVEYERAFREELTRSLAAKEKAAHAALNELRAEYRVVTAECATLRRRFADAHDDAEDARIRARQLERTNSSLAAQLAVAGEAARAASLTSAIAERTAARSRGLVAKVARLRARCGELSACNSNANEAEAGEEDADDDGTVCVICLDVLAEGESVVRLNCMHVFHRDCIMECLSRMRVPSCPLDRIPVTVQLDRLPVSTWGVNASPVSEHLVAPAIVEEED